MGITFGAGGNGDEVEERLLMKWAATEKSLKAKLEKARAARKSGKPDLALEKQIENELDRFQKEVESAMAANQVKILEDIKKLVGAIVVRAPKFKMGRLVVTAGVDAEMKRDQGFSDFVGQCVQRHATGDWGDMDPEDKKQNEWALKHAERLMSGYEQKPFPKIWIITERDRSVTTVLFPEEY